MLCPLREMHLDENKFKFEMKSETAYFPNGIIFIKFALFWSLFSDHHQVLWLGTWCYCKWKSLWICQSAMFPDLGLKKALIRIWTKNNDELKLLNILFIFNLTAILILRGNILLAESSLLVGSVCIFKFGLKG